MSIHKKITVSLTKRNVLSNHHHHHHCLLRQKAAQNIKN